MDELQALQNKIEKLSPNDTVIQDINTAQSTMQNIAKTLEDEIKNELEQISKQKDLQETLATIADDEVSHIFLLRKTSYGKSYG